MSTDLREFKTGAKRSKAVDHLRLDLITPIGLAAVAEVYNEGWDDEYLDDELTAAHWVGFARRAMWGALAGDWGQLAFAGAFLMEAAQGEEIEAGRGPAEGEHRDFDGLSCGWEDMPAAGLRAVARAYKEGEKYGDYNWERGMPVSDLLNHAFDHLNSWTDGDFSEPQIGKALWGVLGAIHSLEMWPHLNTDLRGPGCTPPVKAAKTFPESTPENVRKQRESNREARRILDEIADGVYADLFPEPHAEPAPKVANQETFCSNCTSKATCDELGCFNEWVDKIAPPDVPRPHRIPRLNDPRDGSVPAPVLYVSGPMSGYEAFNFPAFNRAADALRAKGFPVLNPADFGWAEEDWAKNLHRDLVVLGYADILVQLPGWENSRGASLELSCAVALGKGVVSLSEILCLS